MVVNSNNGSSRKRDRTINPMEERNNRHRSSYNFFNPTSMFEAIESMFRSFPVSQNANINFGFTIFNTDADVFINHGREAVHPTFIDELVIGFVNRTRRNVTVISRENLNKITVEEATGEEKENCTICFEKYLKKDKCRVLKCKHMFHKDCVDPWLLNSSATCPICREKVE